MMIQDSIDLLREMIATPSLSFEEGDVAQLIFSRLSEWGIQATLPGGNIVAVNRHYDPSRKTLALDAHMDTVPAASSYTRDPHDPGTDSDTVWGLGSNDDGGSVVAMAAAFRYFYDRDDLPINLMLIINREEERSGPDGDCWLFGEGGYFDQDDTPGRPEWVIIGEPTGMRAATSERGLLVLDCHATGVSGHAARGEGVNALYIALEDIEKMRAHKFARHSETMGDVHLTVTQINAGTAHNVVPDGCDFVVDIRPTNLYDNEEIVEELQAECRSILKPRSLKNRSSATYEGSELLKTAERLGIETFSSPTTSNWIRIKGDCIKMGPGDSARSHHADEYIKTKEVADGVGRYIEFIETFINGYTLE